MSLDETQASFFDVNELVRDVSSGEALTNFMEKYKDMNLDVVSMSEIKNIMNRAQSSLPFEG